MSYLGALGSGCLELNSYLGALDFGIIEILSYLDALKFDCLELFFIYGCYWSSCHVFFISMFCSTFFLLNIIS